MTTSDGLRLRAVVHGRVQGVGFRRFVLREARARELSGWVRNRDDGAVELEAAGDRRSVDAFMGVVRRGPPGADVQRIETFPSSSEIVLPRPFSVRDDP